MVFAHAVKVSVFVKQGEDAVSIERALRSMFPFSLDDEKVVLQREVVSVFFDKKMVVLSVVLKKAKHISAFLDFLVRRLSVEVRCCIVEQAGSRLDVRLCFFLRFDKTLLQRGVFSLTDGGDCFHVKMDVAVFPKKREAGLVMVRDLFSERADKRQP